MSVPVASAVVWFLFAIFCHLAKPDGQKQDDKKPKKAAKSLKVLDPKAGQNLCKYLLATTVLISTVCSA